MPLLGSNHLIVPVCCALPLFITCLDFADCAEGDVGAGGLGAEGFEAAALWLLIALIAMAGPSPDTRFDNRAYRQPY